MDDLNFINYSRFFNEKINAFQVFADESNKLIDLNKFRSLIVKKLSININDLAIPNQVHSNRIQFIQEAGFFKNTDGLITDVSNIVLSLQTADCLPIFLFDKSNNIKGLVHSGWRGTKDKIILNALNIITEKGSKLSDIIIVIGASIHKCCYQIGKELLPFFDSSCIYRVKGNIYLSLHEQILIDLEQINMPIDNIYIDKRCTFTDSKLSSYRRDKNEAGRMLSFLGSF